MNSCTAEGTVTGKKGIDIKVGSKSPNAPRRMVYGQAKVGGIWDYAETSGASNEYIHYIVMLCDGPIFAIDQIYFGDELVTLDANGQGTGKWASVIVRKHLGAANQEAESMLVGASAGKWTTAHQLKGIAYLYIRITNWDASDYAAGPSPALYGDVPDVSAVVRGRNVVFDPRLGISGFTDNAALCLADYRKEMKAREIDTASLAVAADACDVMVSGRPRYVVGGVIESTASVEDVTRQFLAAMAGKISVNGMGYFLKVGEPAPPTLTLSWGDLRGNPKVKRSAPDPETVTASYAGAETNWQASDATGEVDAARSLRLELVNNSQQAAQLETIANKETSAKEMLAITCSLAAFDLATGDAVDINLQPLTYGRFEVVDWSLTIDVEPTIQMTLEKQRSGLFDIIEVPAATAPTLNINRRTLAINAPTPGPNTYTSGSYPITLTLTGTPGGTIRYSTTGYPTSASDGLPYFGPFQIGAAAQPAGTNITVYAAVFRNGWTTARGAWLYATSA